MAKPTVLLVVNDSSRTGAPSQVRLIATSLKFDYDIICCCPDGWLKQELEKSDIAIRPWPTGGFRVQKNALATLYRQVNPSIVHCHGVRAGIVGRLATRPSKTKAIYTEHLWTNSFRLKNPFRQWLQLFLLHKAGKRGDWTVAVSEAVKRFLISNHLSNSSQTSVIYGAIEPIEARPDLDGQVIGTLGRLTWVKGIPTLLRAVSLLKERYPELVCRIGGDGPEKERYLQLATELGIQKTCQWLGKDPELAAFYGSLTIYVQSSVSESFGLAVGEAMSAGVPVIASRVGGLIELVTDNDTGLLFSSGDAQGLANKIGQLLSDKNLRERLSKSGQKRAASFSADRLLAEHQKLYDNLTNG
jgi:glycosyltransferase involved in cell wall biosynthesis